MATSNSYFSRQNHRFLAPDQNYLNHHHNSSFEFDESDIYDRRHAESPEFRKQMVGSRNNKKATAARLGDRARGTPSSSLPVNIPDWSKILKDEYRGNGRRVVDDDEDEDDEEVAGGDYFDDGGGGGEWVPPHELLARQRIASLSVQEGIGRTLKGRDMSRVRNAIWEKTGFQD
ncbi:hypothetical protein LINPERPRIM_LOCUS40699 [Linum perenne]